MTALSERPRAPAALRPGARLTAPAPPERLAALRLLTGGFAWLYLAARVPHLLASARLPDYRWQPVGVLGGLDRPPPVLAVHLLIVAVLAAGLGFVSGWRWRLSGPAFAVGMLLLMTYGVSWGHILHTENLLVLHLLVLGAAPAADAWSLDARSLDARSPGARSPAARREPLGRYGFPVRLISLVTVLTYAIAGWAKLRNSGWEWLSGDVLRNQVAMDNLRKVVLGDRWSPLGAALVGQSWLWRPIGVVTVAVELGAPLVLVFRRARLPWAVSAWLFHVGTLALMAIMFPYPLSGVAFASLFPVERLVHRIAARWSARGRDDRRATAPRCPERSAGPG